VDLNNPQKFKQLDPQDMLSHISNLPDQLAQAWELGQTLTLPEWESIQYILVAGMGGSAIGGDLLTAYLAPTSPIPINTLRDYQLPAWAEGERILVICSSHSGNTEEVLSVFEQAKEKNCRLMAITTGGALADKAQITGYPVWLFAYDFQPRAAVGYSFGLLLAAAAKLGLFEDPSEDIHKAIQDMKIQQETLLPTIPDTNNPAKQVAGQMIDRWITVFAADFLAPVARRWKTQINELANAQASFELLPEADHNTLQGIEYPVIEKGKAKYIFLRSTFNHPRNQKRIRLTKQAFMLQGRDADFFKVRGQTRLSHLWTALHFGDYVSYYLAMAYEADPTPVDMLVNLKKKMKDA
jgi:glucose/mannose-6-phosphate isomerase